MKILTFKKLASVIFLVLVIFLVQSFAFADDILMKAMEDEMSRTLQQLQLKDLGKPYFVEYGANDSDSYSVKARFGGIESAGFDRSKTGSTQVRIGDYDFDNTNLYTTFSMANSFALVEDDDYNVIRKLFWLYTDATYKSSIEQMSAKKAYLQNNVVDEKLPDLSHEKPIVLVQDKIDVKVDAPKWEKFVKDLSAIFKKYPELDDSSVSFFVRANNRYLVNSEGTRLRVPGNLIALNIYASTITSDNLKLTPSRHIYAKSFDQMPSFEEITKIAEKLAQDTVKVRNAPIFDENYIGPVLFTERASIQLFSQLLATNLAVERPPLTSRGGERGVFSERVNRRILPLNISVTDDPTISDYKGVKLLGGYDYDAQGVAAKPLNIVENGILKTLLANRIPTKLYPQSNGRARSEVGGPFISNLIVEAKNGKTFSQLKQDLIDSCKAQSLSFGILFREIDSTFSSFGGGLTKPVLAYKVYVADGHEELVRNLSIDNFPVRELRQILAVGNDSFTLNHLSGNGHQGMGTPYSVTAPSVLLDELVLRRDTSTKSKPPIITNPYFNK